MVTREQIHAEVDRVSEEKLEELHKLIRTFTQATSRSESQVAINAQERPFRRDPRLMGIQFHEDPVAGISSEDWPEAFE